jgi:very-short-patch-repair endonuclease
MPDTDPASCGMNQVIHNRSALIGFRKKLRNAMTPPEVILWAYLKNSGIGYKFCRQHSIGGYIVDFYCAAKQLVVEIDGDQHGEPKSIAYDKVRDQFLEQCKLRVLRIPARSVMVNRYGVLDTIRCMLRYSK